MNFFAVTFTRPRRTRSALSSIVSAEPSIVALEPNGQTRRQESDETNTEGLKFVADEPIDNLVWLADRSFYKTQSIWGLSLAHKERLPMCTTYLYLITERADPLGDLLDAHFSTLAFA